MRKKICAVILGCVLCLASVLFVGCGEQTYYQDYTPMKEDTIADHQSAIDRNAQYFSVSLHEHTATKTRVDIKNISSKSFKWVFLNLVFASDEGIINRTADAGVYSAIAPNQTVSIYLADLDREATQGFVVSYIENYSFK